MRKMTKEEERLVQLLESHDVEGFTKWLEEGNDPNWTFYDGVDLFDRFEDNLSYYKTPEQFISTNVINQLFSEFDIIDDDFDAIDDRKIISMLEVLIQYGVDVDQYSGNSGGFD